MNQLSGRLALYYASCSGFLGFIKDRTAIDDEADADNQLQDQQEEAERYRRATFVLLDKGRGSIRSRVFYRSN